MAKTVRKQKIVKEEKSPKVTKKISKKAFLSGLALLVIVGLIYFGVKSLFVATVNGQPISRLSVIKVLEKQGGTKTLDSIILKTLINQEAKKRNVNVSEKELDAEVSKIEENITAQGATLDVFLEQQGMTKTDLIDEIRLQLLVTKMVEGNISVTDKEIDDYLASQQEQSLLASTEPTPELSRDQVKEGIKQQKLQAKIQTFVADLRSKAKINYFIKY